MSRAAARREAVPGGRRSAMGTTTIPPWACASRPARAIARPAARVAARSSPPSRASSPMLGGRRRQGVSGEARRVRCRASARGPGRAGRGPRRRRRAGRRRAEGRHAGHRPKGWARSLPLCGGRWAGRQAGSGRDEVPQGGTPASGRDATGMKGSTRSCTVAPPLRDFVPTRPASRATLPRRGRRERWRAYHAKTSASARSTRAVEPDSSSGLRRSRWRRAAGAMRRR